MTSSAYHKELPLNTVNLNDLLMQFKVMQALGYSSMFDENFRRELRNPLRKLLYYRLVSASDASEVVILTQALKHTADRIGFFSNPELAQKIRQKEEEDRMATDPEYAQEVLDEQAKKYEEVLKRRGETMLLDSTK